MAGLSPTAIVFVMDSVRCQNPNTFMSNMLFCCSILYKTRLPIIIVFNKADVADATVPIGWMTDFESFMDEVRSSSNYLSSLSRSLALALEEFYANLSFVAVSSVTGNGFEELVGKFPGLIKEYNETYKPDLEKARGRDKDTKAEEERVAEELKKVEEDSKKK